MGKKRGRKVSYETFGGVEIKALINGKEYGIKQHKRDKIYYSMLPDSTTISGTKQHSLGSDKGVAVAKFNALVAEIRGEQEKFTTVEVKNDTIIGIHKLKHKPAKSLKDLRRNLKEYAEDDDLHLIDTGMSLADIPEAVHIEWLKNELQNPKELARKTGIEQLAQIGKLIIFKDSIPLADILKNYLNKKRTLSDKEAYNSKNFFNEFIDTIGCKNVDEITLEDIHTYEDFLHAQKTKQGKKISPKSIKNKMNKISTIFKYNLGRYASNELQQVYNWLRGLDRPLEDKPFNPTLMTKNDFEKLYEASTTKYKLMLLLGLNCGMYPIDLIRLKKENIDFKKGTIAFRRGKTGRVLAVSNLWDRTKKVLKQYMKERKVDSEHIFITFMGIPYSKSNAITNAFNEEIRNRAKVSKEVKFNHLRDTFATLAQDLGYSLDQINLVLGHRTGINDRYAARNASKLTKEICDAVEEEFFKEEEEDKK